MAGVPVETSLRLGVVKDLGLETDITRFCFPEFLPARFSESV